MKAKFDIFRKKPDDSESYRQLIEINILPGQTVLDVFHQIQEEIDPSFAYRYSCRGAICGSCAVRINGEAALACKTQVAPLAEKGVIVVDPLANLAVIKDLVSDFEPFWAAFEQVRPFIERKQDNHDEKLTWDDKMSAKNLDQMNRAIDCIKCAACFSDCPKRTKASDFVGPAASITLYKFYFDPRDDDHEWRGEFAASTGGVFDCDSHANCVKVCPKDCRPLRAINFMKQDISSKRGD